MEKVTSFIQLICGKDLDSNNELDQILTHIKNSLLTITSEIINLENSSDEKFCLYGPYLGRAILELTMTALVARIDPFRILLMKRKQEHVDYDLGKPHSSALRWQGDVVDNPINNLWDDKTLKDPSRAIFAEYQITLVLKKSVELVVDTGDEEVLGLWYTHLTRVPTESVIPMIKNKMSTAYSALSKGIHHEFLVAPRTLLDRDTVKNYLNDVIFTSASISLFISQVAHCYKKVTIEDSFRDYKKSKELELN